MSKPIIGVMPLWDDEKESLWMQQELILAESHFEEYN